MRRQQSIIYPIIDVDFMTRVSKERVKNKVSLLKYTHKILASETKYFNQKSTNSDHLKKMSTEDGMVFGFREMLIQHQRSFYDANNKQHYFGPKILMCVCMYNEGIDAINLTLGGIYNNL